MTSVRTWAMVAMLIAMFVSNVKAATPNVKAIPIPKCPPVS